MSYLNIEKFRQNIDFYLYEPQKCEISKNIRNKSQRLVELEKLFACATELNDLPWDLINDEDIDLIEEEKVKQSNFSQKLEYIKSYASKIKGQQVEQIDYF